MKMFRIHRKYLINKINVLLLEFVALIGIIINYLCIKRINSEYNWFDGSIAVIEYLEVFLMYYKLIVINLICFLWGSFFTKSNNSYHLLITGYKQLKLRFILTKLSVLLIITIFVVFVNFYFMSLIGVLCCNFISIDKIIIELLLKVLLICIIYGLLSTIFSILINSNYACFISVGLFVLCELLSDNFANMRAYYVFFPGLSLNGELCFGLIQLFLLVPIYAFLVVLSYLCKK